MSEQSNVDFVREVEKHPCLYNSSLMEYSRKDLTDKAWKEVGDKLNMSGPRCKEKWKNLRTVLARNLRQTSGTSPTRRKPYYLLEAMKFTIPFIKSPYIIHAAHYPAPFPYETNEQPDSAPPDEDESKQDYVQMKMEEDANEMYQSGTPSPQSHSSQHERYQQLSPKMYSLLTPSLVMDPDSDSDTLETKSKRRKMRKTSATERHQEGVTAEKSIDKTKKIDLAKTSRKRFLLSLLSDVYAMNDDQMRTFRIKVLNVIEEIVQTPNKKHKA